MHGDRSISEKEPAAIGKGGVPILPLASLRCNAPPGAQGVQPSGRTISSRQREAWLASPTSNTEWESPPTDDEPLECSTRETSGTGEGIALPETPQLLTGTRSGESERQRRKREIDGGRVGGDEQRSTFFQERLDVQRRMLDDSFPGFRQEIVGSHDVLANHGAGNAAIPLVLGLARASARPRQTELLRDAGLMSSQISTAKLLVSFLPPMLAEDEVGSDILVAWRALASIGTLLWIVGSSDLDGGLSSAVLDPCPETGEGKTKARTAEDASPGPILMGGIRDLQGALATVDVVTLARCLAAMGSESADVRSRYTAPCDRVGRHLKPDLNRDRVRAACRQALEHAWLARLVLRKILKTSTVNQVSWSRSFGVEATMQVVRYCGEALRRILGQHDDSLDIWDFYFATEALCFSSSDVFSGGLINEPGALLICTPVLIDLVSCVEIVSSQMTRWNEDSKLFASTLNCMTSSVFVLPMLVSIAGRLMLLISAGDTVGESPSISGYPKDPFSGSLCGASKLARIINGNTAPLEELLAHSLACLRIVLSRSAISLSASQAPRKRNRGISLPNPYVSPRRGVERTAKAMSSAADLGCPGMNCEERKRDAQDNPQENGGDYRETSPEVVSDVVYGAVLHAIATTIPIFGPNGGILTLLRAGGCYPRAHPSSVSANGDESFGTQLEQARRECPRSILAGVLRLIAEFVALWVSCDLEHDAFHPEAFVAPLFEGLSACMGRNRRPHGAEGIPRGAPGHHSKSVAGEISRGGVDDPGEGHDLELSLLYLDVLRGLAIIEDRATWERISSLGIWWFLMQGFLTSSLEHFWAGDAVGCLPDTRLPMEHGDSSLVTPRRSASSPYRVERRDEGEMSHSVAQDEDEGVAEDLGSAGPGQKSAEASCTDRNAKLARGWATPTTEPDADGSGTVKD